MNYIIRQAVPADKPYIEKLFAEMLRSIYNTDDTEEYEAGYLDKFFGGSADRIFVAVVNGETAAYISVEAYPEHIYLDDFSVSEKYRKIGIGTALVKRAEEYAGELGLTDVELHVEKSNASALRLYEKLGYRIADEEESRFKMTKKGEI